MSAYLFVLKAIIISIATAGWSEWFGLDRNVTAAHVGVYTEFTTLQSDNNATITRICVTTSDDWHTSISAYFSDHHAAFAGKPYQIDRNCTNKMTESECFSSVYVTYDTKGSGDYSMLRGLQLRTSDHKLLDLFGTMTGKEGGIASGTEHECLTGIDVYFVGALHVGVISRIRFHFSDPSDLEDVVSDPSDLENVVSETGWSQWFRPSHVVSDEIITLKSANNASIIQICASLPTTISAYFSDHHGASAGDPLQGERQCTDTVNEGECFTSVYVTWFSLVGGLQLMTSNDALFHFLGATNYNKSGDYLAASGYLGGIASGKPHECLTAINIGWRSSSSSSSLISRIRFYFSVPSDLEDVDSDTLEFVVSETTQMSTTQISTTQISTTQRTSTAIKQQAIVVQIDGESFNMQSNDWSETSSILSAGMIVINVGICAMIMVYKMCGHRSQERNDEEGLLKKQESFDVDAVTKKGDGETLEIELTKREAPTPKKKKGKTKPSMSTH